MSLVNIQGKLSRAEMKKIMAGSSGGSCPTAYCNSLCTEANNCRCCWGNGKNAYCDDAGNGCPV